MSDQRIRDLQVDHATVGLSPAELAELEAAVCRDPQLDDPSLELAAAAIELAALGEIEPLPDTVRTALHQQAKNVATVQQHRATVSPIDTRRAEPQTPQRSTALPWLLAAAAILAAMVGWMRPVEELPPSQAPRLADAPTPPTVADERKTLLTSASSDTLQLPWTATEDPASQGASGDLVWSNEEQRGYMRFVGLEPNDPAITRYQLWIFDGTRDDRFPIDGGLFDVTASGEVIVPIDARLNVSKPVLFAITVEQPGGVVVSERERIVLIAQSST